MNVRVFQWPTRYATIKYLRGNCPDYVYIRGDWLSDPYLWEALSDSDGLERLHLGHDALMDALDGDGMLRRHPEDKPIPEGYEPVIVRRYDKVGQEVIRDGLTEITGVSGYSGHP